MRRIELLRPDAAAPDSRVFPASHTWERAAMREMKRRFTKMRSTTCTMVTARAHYSEILDDNVPRHRRVRRRDRPRSTRGSTPSCRTTRARLRTTASPPPHRRRQRGRPLPNTTRPRRHRERGHALEPMAMAKGNPAVSDQRGAKSCLGLGVVPSEGMMEPEASSRSVFDASADLTQTTRRLHATDAATILLLRRSEEAVGRAAGAIGLADTTAREHVCGELTVPRAREALPEQGRSVRAGLGQSSLIQAAENRRGTSSNFGNCRRVNAAGLRKASSFAVLTPAMSGAARRSIRRID